MHRYTHNLTLTAIVALSAIALPFAASAAITYVDAAEGASGNTFVTSGGSTDVDATSWTVRNDVGNNDTAFKALASATPPELTTQITGLNDGDYNVWVFFWDNGNGWNIDAGLTSGSLTSYSAIEYDNSATTTAGVTAASSLDFTGTVLTTGNPNPTLYGVNIGQATVTDASAIDVFIDHSVGTDATNILDARTRYDGVGYEVVPEPASLGLLLGAASGIFCFVRRRNR